MLALSAFTTAHGQDFFYRVGLGYAIPQAGQLNDGNGTPYNGTIDKTTAEVFSIKGASFSSGVVGNLALGYMFNKHIGVEANLSAVAGKKYTFTYHNISIGGIASDLSIVDQAKTPVFFTPSLVLQTDDRDLNAYVRFGLVLPLKTNVTQDQIITNLPGKGLILTDDFTFNIKNSFSLGFAAAAGFKYRLSERSSFFGELGFMSLSVITKTSTLTAASENGVRFPLTAVTGPQVVNYSKTAVVDSSGTQQPAYALPFSNAGLQVGFSYELGQKSHGKNDLKDRRKKF